MSARVCACVGMFAGVDSVTVAGLLGCSYWHVCRWIPGLVRAGCLSRVRKGRRHLYYLTKKGRRLMAAEAERVRAENLALLSRVRAVGGDGVRLDLVEQMEEALRKGHV